MSQLWEVLVPRVLNSGVEIELAHHKQWDENVRQIAGGLTILKTAKGVWESSDGKIFREEMIPVRIACTEEQINQIISLTIEHHDQEAVMAYRVSDKVIIRHR